MFLKSILFGVLMVCSSTAGAQTLTGSVRSSELVGPKLLLYSTHGEQHLLIDSTRIGKNGQFAFSKRNMPAGFYQLALNDSDRVDVILDPREASVELSFDGIPLQRHILVRVSDENKRLWEYKLVSREAQATQASVAQEKKTLQPTDVIRLAELDSLAAQALRMQREHLDRLLAGAPKSYFAKVVRADRALEGTMRKSPMDVAEEFDFSDGGLLRSSVYDKAVMFFLENLNAVSEEQFVNAADTLMILASRDPECRSYMLNHLIDLFSTYGPELPLQHLIDVYVAPDRGKERIDASLRSKVAELLKVSVGATAPDVPLAIGHQSIALSDAVKGHRYTALFFYSSTCDHCHAQMPVLKEVYAAYHSKGFEVYGIALDADTTEFNKCIAENGLSWPSGSEFTGWGSQAAKKFQVKATPTFFLLDDRMRIVAKPFDAEDLRGKVAGLMK